MVALNRDIYDHVPLHLIYGILPLHSDIFRFENCWFERDGFMDVVRKRRHAPNHCIHDLGKCQEKAIRLRRQFKGSCINMEGVYKNPKETLSRLYELDKKSEIAVLSAWEREKIGS